MKNIVVVLFLGNIFLLCHIQASKVENDGHKLKTQTLTYSRNKDSSDKIIRINKECIHCDITNIFMNDLYIFSQEKIKNHRSIAKRLVKKAKKIIRGAFKKAIFFRNNITTYDLKDKLDRQVEEPDFLYKPGPEIKEKDKSKIQLTNDQEELSKLIIRHQRAKMMKKYMDTTVNPCHDFYTFACGNWSKFIPTNWNVYHYNIFDFAKKSIIHKMKTLLELPISDNEPNSFIKAKNYYKSCIDNESIESRGSKPLLTLLDSLGGWPLISNNWNSANFDWISLAGVLSKYSNEALIAYYVSHVKEPKNITYIQINIDQPTTYYYDWDNSNFIKSYMDFIVKIATLLGAKKDNITDAVNDLIKFETSLSKIIIPNDGLVNANKTSLREINTNFPKLDLKRYISAVFNLKDDSNEQVVIHCDHYLTKLGQLLENTKGSTIANYLIWNVVKHWVVYLDKNFKHAYEQFYLEPPINYSKMNCFKEVRNAMKLVVDEMFLSARPNFFQNDTTLITKNIQSSFKEAVSDVSWLNEPAKNTIKTKIDSLKLRIKYLDDRPTKQELDDLFIHVNIDPATYFENFIALTMHDIRIAKAKIDLTKKDIQSNRDIAEVGTYFDINQNEIVASLGIFKPPFYHKHFPQCLNYGGFGGVISHEMLHGFNYHDVMYINGNVANRKTEKSYRQVFEHASCVAEQFLSEKDSEKYPGYLVGAKNIGDSEGIKHVYAAYQKWLNKHGDSDETLPEMNYTSGQLLFLNFAQMWCDSINFDNINEEIDRTLIVPGKFRVISTLRNNKDFSKEFECPLGTPMNPKKKCTAW